VDILRREQSASGVLTLTLHRPERKNAHDLALADELVRALSPDLGGSWLLPRLVGLHRAKELALLGRWVPAEEALALGLVNRVVPPGELDAAVAEWAERLAAGPPVALAQTKRLLAESSGRSFEAAIEDECSAQSVNLATEDTREAFRAFFAKREPRFEGR